MPFLGRTRALVVVEGREAVHSRQRGEAGWSEVWCRFWSAAAARHIKVQGCSRLLLLARDYYCIPATGHEARRQLLEQRNRLRFIAPRATTAIAVLASAVRTAIKCECTIHIHAASVVDVWSDAATQGGGRRSGPNARLTVKRGHDLTRTPDRRATDAWPLGATGHGRFAEGPIYSRR